METDKDHMHYMIETEPTVPISKIVNLMKSCVGNVSEGRQKRKIALCHERITNTRKDYLHKVSHEIISENQVIVSENRHIH